MAVHYHSLDKIHLSQSWLTIGTFDGVHRGHKYIVRSLVDEAHQQNQPAVVVTFHPHPALVLHGDQPSYYLTLPEKRAQLLSDLGVDVIITYPFSKKTSQLSADQFISILHTHLNFKQLWIGHDFALGKNREGNASRLAALGEEYRYILKSISAFMMEDQLVSSSLIRSLLRNGEVKQAAHYLGHLFSFTGEVIPGDNRGKSLGFPTSNLDVPKEIVDLRSGVYACYADVDGQSWKAVTNIGYRPTFGKHEDQPHIEAHLLDFNQEIYGKKLELFFLARLRDEQKFSAVRDLQNQINRDIEKARKLLAQN